MEKIRIKSLDLKSSGMLVVGYVIPEYVGMPVAEATMNTKWQSQEIDFLRKDVGINGEVMVTIQHKPNPSNPQKPYVNITKVDMTSATKGEIEVQVDHVADAQNTTHETPNPQRVGLFIKLAVEMMIAAPREGLNVEENLCENIQEIKKLEEFTVKLLSQ